MKRVSSRLTIAIQKSGRLFDGSWQLLQQCGIRVNPAKNQLICQAENFPIDILLVRDDDIPQLVQQGISDFGIVGENVLQEVALSSAINDQQILKKFNFGNCRLSIAVPNNTDVAALDDIAGFRIATTYPNILRNYLQKNSIKSEAVLLNGSVEMAPRLGIADAVCDLVSSGETLRANNLRELVTILNSQAVLVRSNAVFGKEKSDIADVFMKRVEGVTTAAETKCIMMHLPKSNLDSLSEILPGLEKPTIMGLVGDSEMIALNAVCRETIFWETLEQLKEIGATSILVLLVEKIMR